MRTEPHSRQDSTPSVGIVGAGGWGANHVRVFEEIGALRLICDADPARLDDVRGRHPGIPVTTSFEEVVACEEIDAIVLATPAVTHAALAGEALDAGKDVLVEKPMALSVGEAEDLRDRGAEAGRILAVGHVLEHHPAVRRLYEFVSSGELGRIRYLYSNRLNFGRIRTEESVLWSFAPHDIAIMLRLLGHEPTTVFCQGASYLNPDVADTTLTSMTFPGDVQAHIYVSWLHPFKEHRFVVVGDRRMVVFEDTAPWPEKLVCYEHTVDWAGGQVPVARKAGGEVVPVEESEPLRRQAEDFLRAVRTREAPLCHPESGLAVLRVLRGAQRSLEEGGGPVRIDGLEGVFVHPTAAVDAGAEVGAGTKVWHQAHIMGDARIGRDCTLGQNVFVGRGVRIGDSSKIQNDVSVYEGVTLEEGVFCGPAAVFTNVRNPRAEIDRHDDFTRTIVRRGATIGANATIVCGVTVGRDAFVGAGAVVTRDVPDGALVVGNPARAVGWICRCGERLPESDEPECATCGRTYGRSTAGLRER